MAFFFFFAVHTFFFSLFLLSQIDMLDLQTDHADDSTIYKYFKLLFRIQLVLDCGCLRFFLCAHCRSLRTFLVLFSSAFFDNFFQVSFSRIFRLHLKGFFFFGHLFSQFISLFLIYYFVMWVEFAGMELLARPGVSMKTNEKVSRWIESGLEISKNSSLRMSARSLNSMSNPIILNYILPSHSFASWIFDVVFCVLEMLQLMALNENSRTCCFR